ncbi:MAG: oligopeptidase B [Vulcanimicrobiaceae bacterium]
MATTSNTAAAATVPLARDAGPPPVATKVPHEHSIHGITRHDEYFWLRRKSDPKVRAYLEAETAYAEAVMKPTEALQKTLYDEILGHIKQTDLSVPYRRGEYFYYSRTEEGKQYPIYARKRGSLDAPEEITLDLNALAAGHSYLGLGSYQISDDGNLLAYSVDTTGYRQYTLRVKDLRTGDDLAEAIPRVDSVEWATDNATLFYTTEDDVSKRHDRFWRHALGAAESTLLFEEHDERYDVGALRSNDRAYVFLVSASKSTTEWRAIRAAAPASELAVVIPRSDGHRASVEHHGTDFYILSNRGAEDFKLVTTPDATPQEAHWKTIVSERAGIHLADISMFEHYAVLDGRSGGFSNLEILELASGRLETVPFDEAVHSVFPAANPEYRTNVFRYTYTSLVTPASVYEIDLATGARELLKTTEVPGYDPEAYETELKYATARDGTKIPISIVSRTGIAHDGKAPMLLYAYGSYGISMDPTFSAARLVLLDRGVVFAIAHVRGGGELGERWRTAGHLREKLNTFTDFIDCADDLIESRYTSADRLVIQGGSAGGLLVGAVSNMRPDLFRAVVSQVPFVDVMNTMLDASLPLTTSEYLEWGDPNVASDYDYMMRYSPYDNVRAQAYPTTLVKVSVNDSQVPYWEGAKLVAKMRALKTDGNPLLLMVNFGAGHGGASGRYDALKETAFNDAFILAEIAGDR